VPVDTGCCKAAAVCMVCLERWGADRGSHGQKAVGGMAHAKLAGNSSRGTGVHCIKRCYCIVLLRPEAHRLVGYVCDCRSFESCPLLAFVDAFVFLGLSALSKHSDTLEFVYPMMYSLMVSCRLGAVSLAQYCDSVGMRAEMFMT
jgi:hypothetical protein